MVYWLVCFFPEISSSKKKLIVTCAVGGTGLILTVITLLLWHQRSSEKKEIERGTCVLAFGSIWWSNLELLFISDTISTGNVLGTAALRGSFKYKYKDLKTGTNNFSEANKLGGGGFGDVYKASNK